MSENTQYVWTDRFERAYASLKIRAGHWRVEWGFRVPPGSDVYLKREEHQTSDAEEAITWLLERLRPLVEYPDEAALVEAKLREAVRESAAERGTRRRRK